VATNVISTFNWNNTNQVPERFLLDAGMPGTRETWFLSERQTNTLYYVALKVLTTNGWTMMSKLVRVMTRDSLATVRVVWDMPTNNVDGSVLTDLAGAKIYYGLESSNYTTVIDVGFVTTYVISNLLEGVSYYVSCTAYNTSGIESGFSKELYKPIP
jgi:hypothetical protein